MDTTSPSEHSVGEPPNAAAARGHTPGPWESELIGANGLVRIVARSDPEFNEFVLIADVAPWNAPLVVEAPELLACLQDAVEDSQQVLDERIAALGENFRPARLKAMRAQIARARAAINKALGGAEP